MNALEIIVFYGLPAMLVIGMVGVGLDIQRAALDELRRQPLAIASITLLQAILLPIAGMVTLVSVRPASEAATMLLLLAACPGGGISNLFTLIARANTALSVAMTLASLAGATITVALAIHFLKLFGMPTGPIGAVPLDLVFRIAAMMLVPATVGAAICWRAPTFAKRAVPVFLHVTLALILLVVGAVVWLEADAIWEIAFDMVAVASLFVAIALGIGSLVGRSFFKQEADRSAVMLEFGTRNVAVASTLAVGIAGEVILAGAATVFFIVETAMCTIIAAGIGRRRRE